MNPKGKNREAAWVSDSAGMFADAVRRLTNLTPVWLWFQSAVCLPVRLLYPFITVSTTFLVIYDWR